MIKFNRNFRLEWQTSKIGDEPMVVEPPFTLDFTITRNVLNTANLAVFTLYNIGAATPPYNARHFYKSIENEVRFLAGYGNASPTVFRGNIVKIEHRQESQNVITEITAEEGRYDINHNKSVENFPAGKTRVDLIKYLAGKLKYTRGIPIVGEFEGTIDSELSFPPNKTAWELLNENADNQCYIDDGRVIAINQGESFAGPLSIISSQDVIGTFKYIFEAKFVETLEKQKIKVDKDAAINIKLLFEPRLMAGQVVDLDNLVFPDYENEHYIVYEIKHTSTASKSNDNKWLTDVTLLRMEGKPKIVSRIVADY